MKKKIYLVSSFALYGYDVFGLTDLTTWHKPPTTRMRGFEYDNEDQDGKIDNVSKLTYNIEDVYNMSIENLIGGYSLQNSLTNQESLINPPSSSINNIGASIFCS